jgi:hypothetical protein
VQSREYAEAVFGVAEAYASRDLERVRDVMCPHGGEPEISLERMSRFHGKLHVPVVEIIQKLEFVTRTDGKVRVDLPLLPAPALPSMGLEDLEDLAVGYLIIHISKSASRIRTCLYDVLASF